MFDTAVKRRKAALRKELRVQRQKHVAAMPDSVRGLLFRHPPRPILDRIGHDAVIGLYHATRDEAPTEHYAAHFHERGHTLALPRLTEDGDAMVFIEHTDPLSRNDLVVGPFGLLQPASSAAVLIPDLVFAPLIGFTSAGERLGQGGGHYDRWLQAHSPALVVGLAWDCQLIEELPSEAHDRKLDAVITPTKLFEAH